MKLKQIASNMTELQIGDITMLFSYSTPVAGYDDGGAFRTTERHSVTTTKHINKYLGRGVGREISQGHIDSLYSNLGLHALVS